MVSACTVQAIQDDSMGGTFIISSPPSHSCYATHDTFHRSPIPSPTPLDSLITLRFHFTSLITFSVTIIIIKSRHWLSHAGGTQRRRHVQWSLAIGRCLDEYEFDGCHLHVRDGGSLLEIARVLYSGECHQVSPTLAGGSGTSRGGG
jgi:hypothetical protein